MFLYLWFRNYMNRETNKKTKIALFWFTTESVHLGIPQYFNFSRNFDPWFGIMLLEVIWNFFNYCISISLLIFYYFYCTWSRTKSFKTVNYLYYVSHSICVAVFTTLLQTQLNESSKIYSVGALCRYEATNPYINKKNCHCVCKNISVPPSKAVKVCLGQDSWDLFLPAKLYLPIYLSSLSWSVPCRCYVSAWRDVLNTLKGRFSSEKT
jgi:hypothetical protein